MAEPKKRTRFCKGKDFPTVGDLETRCKKHEQDLTAKLIKLEIVQNAGGEKGTEATYEEVESLQVSKLIFEEFDDDADANVKSTAHKLAGDTPVLPGDEPRAKVFVGDKSKNILVFRGK